MLIPYNRLDKWIVDSQFHGVIHGGAHAFEEYDFYNGRNSGRVYWFEADDETISKYRHLMSVADTVYNVALWSESGKAMTFNKANNDQSSSVFNLKTHATAHPEVHYVDSFAVMSATLDDVAAELFEAGDPALSQAEFMNLDLQGAELQALRGATELLEKSVHYIYTEVNVEELYEGCGFLGEIEEFLSQFGFVRRELELTHFGWGDAFFVKREPKWY